VGKQHIATKGMTTLRYFSGGEAALGTEGHQILKNVRCRPVTSNETSQEEDKPIMTRS